MFHWSWPVLCTRSVLYAESSRMYIRTFRIMEAMLLYFVRLVKSCIL
jgi:hypothetical protein